MKRTCNGCKALGMVGDGCGLGYKTEVTRVYSYVPVEWKPLEECPKPLTNDKLIVEMNKSEKV